MMQLRALLLVLLISAPATSACAERWQAPGGGATINFPDGDHWNVIDTRSAMSGAPSSVHLVVRRTTDERKLAMLTVASDVPQRKSFEQEIKDFESGLLRDKPARKVSGTHFEIQGRPAYRVVARRRDGVWLAGVFVREDRTLYSVGAFNADGDPTLDPELGRYLDSLRLP